MAPMELGIHLPLMEFGDEGFSRSRLERTVDAARDSGFAAVSANDHFVFSTPWLDGSTALAAIADRSGEMALATTISNAVLRGPVPLAKTLAALDILSGGRLIAGLGPGSSKRDYEAVGVPFEERWKRLDEAVVMLRSLLSGEVPAAGRYFPAPDCGLAPPPRQQGGVPLWIGSWGSEAGLRRVARLADGWLASAYNTSPERFSKAVEFLGDDFPNALVSMWTWVTERRPEAERVLHDTLAPLLHRDPEALRGQVCVGSAEMCAELLSKYAEAGCGRVHFWPLGDETRQIELIASEVARRIVS